MVEQYGIHYDRRKAIKCAWNWCSKAARMGGGWAFYEEQAEVMLFMHYRFEWVSEFSHAWMMYKEEARRFKKKPGSALEADEELAPAKKSRSKKKHEKEETPDQDQDDNLPVVMKKFNEVRQFYTNTTTQATNISTLIATQVSWGFANNEQLKGKLTQLQDAVEKSCTPFFRAVLTSTQTQLKKNHPAAELRGDLGVAEDMNKKVAELDEWLKQLQATHAIFNPGALENKRKKKS